MHLIRDGLLSFVLHLPQEAVLLVLRSTLLVHVRYFKALEVRYARNVHTYAHEKTELPSRIIHWSIVVKLSPAH